LLIILFCNSVRCRVPATLAAAFFTVVVLTAFGAFADNTTPDQSQQNADQQLHITSDSLMTDNEAKYAEFIGNVRAIQGPNIITSDKLKVYFKEAMSNSKNPVASADSIQKLVATGNVIINFDNKVAVAQKAVYITDTRILVLTGTDSKITSGKDSISGEKITLFRADGRINVESGAEKRVEAMFFSGQKGLK